MNIIAIIAMLLLAVIALVISLNPKIRGKIIARKIKSVKYATREARDDIEEISSTIKDAIKKENE